MRRVSLIFECCVCVLVHSAYAMHATQHVRHMYQFRVHSKGPPPTPLLLLFLLVSCLGFVVVFRFLLLACFSLSVLSFAVCLSVCLLACCLVGGGSLHESFVYKRRHCFSLVLVMWRRSRCGRFPPPLLPLLSFFADVHQVLTSSM